MAVYSQKMGGKRQERLEWLGELRLSIGERMKGTAGWPLTDRFSGSGRRIKDLHERYDTNETGAGGNSWHSEALSKSQLDKKFVGRSE